MPDGILIIDSCVQKERLSEEIFSFSDGSVLSLQPLELCSCGCGRLAFPHTSQLIRNECAELVMGRQYKEYKAETRWLRVGTVVAVLVILFTLATELLQSSSCSSSLINEPSAPTVFAATDPPDQSPLLFICV